MIDVSPLLIAEGRPWTLADSDAQTEPTDAGGNSVIGHWPGGLRLVLDATPIPAGCRLSVHLEASRTVTIDHLGVRIRCAGMSRVLVDGYHSWDWAGTRDGAVPGRGWWSAIAGTPGSSRRLHIYSGTTPAAGALMVGWDGDGTFDALTCGEPVQVGERTGAPGPLGVVVAAGHPFTADAVDVTESGVAGTDATAGHEPGRSARHSGARRIGWMSWNCRGAAVTAGDMREARALVPAGGVLLLDDGWMERWGDWRATARLGGTVAGLACDLKRTGHDLGLWVAPFLVDSASDLAAAHPDWLLRHGSGDLVVDARPPRPQWVLDASRDPVAAHMRALGRDLAAAGARVLKADFLYAGALPGERAAGWSGVRALRRGLQAVATGFRSAGGAGTEVWACGAPGPVVRGLVECCRSGGDAVLRVPALGVRRPGPPTFVHGPAVVRAQMRNLAARAWLWGPGLRCDVDAVTLGQVGDTPPVDAGALDEWLRMVDRSGGPFLDSDVLAGIDQIRRGLLLDAMTRPWAGAERPADPLEMEPAAMTDDDFLSWATNLPQRWEPA